MDDPLSNGFGISSKPTTIVTTTVVPRPVHMRQSSERGKKVEQANSANQLPTQMAAMLTTAPTRRICKTRGAMSNEPVSAPAADAPRSHPSVSACPCRISVAKAGSNWILAKPKNVVRISRPSRSWIRGCSPVKRIPSQNSCKVFPELGRRSWLAWTRSKVTMTAWRAAVSHRACKSKHRFGFLI